MEKFMQSIIAAFSKTLEEVAGAKVLFAIGAFATFTAMKQYDEASLIALTFLGIGGAREIVKTVTAGKTDAAAAQATAAVAAAPPAAAAAAATVADTLASTPAPAPAPAAPGEVDITRNDIVAEAPDAPEPLTEDEPDEGF